MNPMKPLHSLLVLLASAMLAAAPAAHAVPSIERWTTAGGAQVQFVPDAALPMVDIQIDFAAGSAHEPTDKAGLASLTRLLLEAGAADLDEQAIAERSADIGAQFGGGTDDDRSSLSVRSLSSGPELDAAVELAAMMLAQPTFPAAVLERERGRAIAGLREALTRPATLAARSFAAAIYAGHPYGVPSTEDSLRAIGREAVIGFHRRHYRAALASITIVGDVDRAGAERIAQRLVAGLPQDGRVAALPAPAQPNATTLRIAHPSAQAHILIGLPGMARDDPDYFPLLVGNHVLGGGGFVSRLTHEVREKRGYAYSVHSHFAPRQVAGPFQIGLQTRGGQVEDALKVVDDTLAGFIAAGPDAAELQAAKDNLVQGFGLRLDSNRKVLDHVAMMGFYHLAPDWLERWPQRVAAVSQAQVREAFARRIRRDHLVTVIVGGDGDRSKPESAQ